jgi:hypothetical protein
MRGWRVHAKKQWEKDVFITVFLKHMALSALSGLDMCRFIFPTHRAFDRKNRPPGSAARPVLVLRNSTVPVVYPA